MGNPINLQKFFFRLFPLRQSIPFLLSLCLSAGLGNAVRAQTPETAPPELRETIAQIEAAANKRDLPGVMQFYSSDFSNSDGLSYPSLSEALKGMWANYTNLSYKSELKSWETVGDELMAETVTTIEGIEQTKARKMRLTSTIRSRQYFKDRKIVRQEILAESTQMNSGANPPKVEVSLPEKVNIGEEFDFDVVVREPLGDDELLGAAIEEQVSNASYLNPSNFKLDLLPAGGIFKTVKAPLAPENRWLSAIIVRGDGITLVTQRVRVEK
jgi:hypothetical protein